MIRERPTIGPIVEAMRPGDLDEIVEIEKVSFRTPWGRVAFQEEAGREWAHIWVVRPGAGQAAVGFVNFWLVRDEIHVLNVAVDPEHRRRGYAAEMMQATVKFAWKHQVRYLTLEVRRSNHGAIRLYKAFDFKPIGIRPNYYSDDREDAIVMLLTLGPAST